MSSESIDAVVAEIAKLTAEVKRLADSEQAICVHLIERDRKAEEAKTKAIDARAAACVRACEGMDNPENDINDLRLVAKAFIAEDRGRFEEIVERVRELVEKGGDK